MDKETFLHHHYRTTFTMKNLKTLLLCTVALCLCASFNLIAQENFTGENAQIQMDIPSAPAFSLLGVNPEFISKPSDVKNFKVDWRVKNYQIAPDLALEGQPLWWLYYRNKGVKDYASASSISKVLSTTSLSLGTAKLDGINHLAYAFKWNLYKEKNESQIDTLIKDYMSMASGEVDHLQFKIDSLRSEHNGTNADPNMIIQQIIILKDSIRKIEKNYLKEFREAASTISYNKWNANFLELAVGKVYTYNNGGLDSLKINRAGWGVWMTSGKTVGESGLLSFLVRYNRINANNDIYLGTSFRHGADNYNFFTELIYTHKGNSKDNGFGEDEFFQDNYSEDLDIGWIEFEEGQAAKSITMSYGGEFKLRRNILLNFALKTRMDGDFSFDKLIPVANVICVME